MTDLRVETVSVRRGDSTLVEAADLRVTTGEWVALLGPNGAGKTSLLRAALGLETPARGRATLDGADTATLSPRDRARILAYLPQMRSLAWPNRVRDVVALGRFAHGAALGRLAGADAAAVERALTACDLDAIADRRVDTLSGGELARVHCARAFAAEAPLLVADEPIAGLDPRHQFRILDLIKAFVAAGGGALVVLHDVGLAARYAQRLVWMADGRIVADGPPSETLTAQRLAEVYGVRARVSGAEVAFDGLGYTSKT